MLIASSTDINRSDLTNTSNQSVDPNDSPDQTTRIQMQQQIQNSSCLLSMPTTQIHHKKPQFTPPLQHIPHHPFGAVPVATTDHSNFVYYMPTRQQPQVYSFPLQQLQTNYFDARPAAASNHTIPKHVMIPSQFIYYAAQAVPPLLAAQHQKMDQLRLLKPVCKNNI